MILKHFVLASIICINLFAIADQIIPAKKFNIENDRIIYTIQIATFPIAHEESAISFFQSLEESIRSKSAIYPSNGYLTIRYYPSESKKSLTNQLKYVHQNGFKDAFIANTYLNKFYNFQNKEYHEYREKSTKIPLANKPFKKEEIKKIDKPQKSTLSKYQYNILLNEANNLKNEYNLKESVKKYEQLYNFSQENSLVNNNLFYLYGKTNQWKKAKNKIDKSLDKGNLLYSYGLGALESYNQNLENELKDQLEHDIKGYVSLVLGVFKERQHNYQDAYNYYENAYRKNRFDLFIMFAYARAFELIEDYKKAKQIYFDIATIKSIKYENLRKISYNRYLELDNLGE